MFPPLSQDCGSEATAESEWSTCQAPRSGALAQIFLTQRQEYRVFQEGGQSPKLWLKEQKLSRCLLPTRPHPHSGIFVAIKGKTWVGSS